MKRILALTLSAILILALFTGCQSKSPSLDAPAELSQTRAEELYALSLELTNYLNSGDTDSALAMMSEAMLKAMDGKLDTIWPQYVAALGEFQGTGAYSSQEAEGYEIIEMTLVFEKGSMIQRCVFDGDSLISGLFFRNGEVDSGKPAPTAADSELPDGIIEEAVTVDAGDGHPLAAKLTMPSDGELHAALVLVHGSGPNDMNETVGANAPFRDIAYALAGRGIAVLRYDKRTYSYNQEASQLDPAQPILPFEVLDDARAALELLKARDDIDSSQIYLAGHSMSGGLLAEINADGAAAAGYIILAGTPRNLWQLSAEQNLLAADAYEQAGDTESAAEIREAVAAELARAETISELPQTETLFGMPVSYLMEFEAIDSLALHMADALPILVLQGEADQQVGMADLAAWKEGLAAHPDASFISYPGLNHLFGRYEGAPVSIMELVAVEYAQRTPFSDTVIDDIANWILAHS